MAEKEYFYSNCLIQAVKAKLKNPKQVKITYISPFDNEVFCPHFLWTDGKNDYDFGIEYHLPWYKVLFFKGHIRKRNLGFNQKYKNACKNTRRVKTMAEYIDREALKEEILHGKNKPTIYDGTQAVEWTEECIKNAPAADVQEVRHGKWIISSDGYYPYCSECWKEPKEISEFCPNCGAKMDKE